MQTGQTAPSEQVSGSESRVGTHQIKVPLEGKLDWFFSKGQSLFEASTFGALLERQSAYGQVFETCEGCAGSGFDADDNSCRRCRGFGGTPGPNSEKPLQTGLLFSTTACRLCAREPRRMRWCKSCGGCRIVNGAPCGKCRGKGVPVKKDGSPRPLPARRARPACYACQGTTFNDRKPVGLKAETKPEPSYTPDDVALQMFAQISRYLMRCKPDTVDTLASFFGLSGYQWANTKWGRLFSLVPDTDAGKAMLKRQANKLELGDHELLENLVKSLEKVQEKDHKVRVQEWFETVTRQSAELFRAAAADWSSVVHPPKPQDEPKVAEVAA
jgi:hypothetical protein